MLNNDEVVAIIPARGGSKRLPRKNVLPISGKPCIAWTIEAAINSKFIDHIVVSTDDEETKMIGRMHSDIHIVDRPAELGTDSSTSVDVVSHVLEDKKTTLKNASWLILLQPTSPLRTVEDIDAAFELVDQKHAQGAISVCQVSHPREWIAHAKPGESLKEYFLGTDLGGRVQDFPKAYTINGAIYIIRIDLFMREKTFFADSAILAYDMDRSKSVDIDDEFDFKLAEYLLGTN
jgi:CMP-N-acetylneuraminic acid synthetase